MYFKLLEKLKIILEGRLTRPSFQFQMLGWAIRRLTTVMS